MLLVVTYVVRVLGSTQATLTAASALLDASDAVHAPLSLQTSTTLLSVVSHLCTNAQSSTDPAPQRNTTSMVALVDRIASNLASAVSLGDPAVTANSAAVKVSELLSIITSQHMDDR